VEEAVEEAVESDIHKEPRSTVVAAAEEGALEYRQVAVVA
jgi:hypothetical protein